jgi:hypothetical protein
MSFEMMGRVLKHSESLGTTKMVLMGIAWHMGEKADAGCYPSQETLAHYANTTVRQVRRALTNLIESGQLQSISNGAWMRGSASKTNLYIIKLDCPEWCDGSKFHMPKLRNELQQTRTFMVNGQDIYGL